MVVLGDPELGAAFSAAAFDQVVFTGSTAVGREVVRAAVDRLTLVTLKLGGKSPTTVGEDADLALAAERIMIGKIVNAGQIWTFFGELIRRGERAECSAFGVIDAGRP